MIFITGAGLNRDLIMDMFERELTYFRVTNTTVVTISAKVVNV